MYCSTCGTKLSEEMKYCNRCGARSANSEQLAAVESREERLRGEMVDLFWVTVIGLGLILGGMIAMKSLDLSFALIVGYMIVSSTAFAINVGLSLWQIFRLAGVSKRAKITGELAHTSPKSIGPAPNAVGAPPPVTESTTRNLETWSKSNSETERR